MCIQRDELNNAGYAILQHVLDARQLERFIAIFDALARDARAAGERYAFRDLFREVPQTLDLLSNKGVVKIVHGLLGPGAFAVRGLFFDKVPGRNWPVGWHQDNVIAVQRRAEVAGFGPWSIKAGAVHVKPPASVLERMVTLRLHMDDCPAENGALRVVPGSHQLGFIEGDAIKPTRDRLGAVTCEVPAGGALIMKPLLLHASSPAVSPRHRRVIHIEFAADNLPGGLNWAERRPMG